MPTPRVNSQNNRSPSTEETIVREHLAELRERVRFLTWISGLSWIAVMLLGGLIVTGSLDWLFHFDESGTRLIFGLTLLGGTGWIGWRYLFTPLRQQLSGSFLASRVERRFPHFRGRIVSAVEFLEHRLDQKLGSPELQKAVIGQALNDLAQVNTSDVVEARAIRNVSFAGMGVLGLALLLMLLRPLEAATAVRRLAFPFAKIAWPRSVELQLVLPDLSPFTANSATGTVIARGDNLELYVQNKRGHLPDRVWFEFRTTPDGPVSRELLRQTYLRDAKDQSREAAIINWIATNGTLFFRATGGDDDVMPFQRVDVVQPPIVKSLQVTVNPPAYSKRPVETLPPDVGHVTGLVGTRIDAQIESDKPLKSAMLRIGDHPPVPLELQPDDHHFTASFEIADPVASRYWFELTDRQEFHDREPIRYELRGIADGIPEVTIETPVTDVLLTPTAELPISIFAKDDLGLKDIHLAFQIGDDENIRIIPLFPDPSAVQPSKTSLAASENADHHSLDPLQQQAEHQWKMADLQLQPGSKIVFRAEATDRYDLGQPHVGKSIPRTITIVSSDEKQKELATRVSSILDELDRVAQLQQRARQETKEVQTQLENVGELRPQDLDQLRHVELDQRQTASRLSHPADGVQTKARQLLDEFRANQLSDERTEQRMDSLAAELERLEQEELPKAERALTMAQKLAESDASSKSQTDSEVRTNGEKKNSPGEPHHPDQKPRAQSSDAQKQIDQSTTSDDKTAKDSSTADSGERNSGDQKPAELNDKSRKAPALVESQNGETPVKTSTSPETPNQDKSSTKGKQAPSNTSDVNEPEKSSDENRAESTSPPSTDSASSEDSAKPEQPSEKQPSKNAPSREKAIESALAEAHQRQTRSLETLRELQQSLAEWRDRRDVSRDLESVISEQDTIQKEAAELAERTMTKSAAELTKQDKAELSKLAAKQRKVAEQLEQFRKQLEQMAGSLSKNDPDAAEKLNEVDQELSQQETASRLNDAAQDIAENKMGSAAQSQQKAMDELREAERMIKRKPSDDTEQFVRQTEDALQEFQQIRQEQQDLADQAQELAGQSESPQKQEKLERLKEQQDELAERMAKAERKLERLRLRGAAEATNRARSRLNEMMQQATESDDAEEMQQAMEEAVEDLEQVERELVLEKRIAQERLAFEQLEKIEDELKGLRSRQQAVIEETVRLNALKAERETLTRAQLKSLKELSETERLLQQQAEQMQRQMASAEVVSLVLKRLGRSLGMAADRLAERETDTPTQSLESDAIRKIDSLLLVLAKDQKKPENSNKSGEKQESLSQEQQEQDEKPEEAQPPGDTIPQLAQIKLLKTMQEEYLERTEMLNKFRDKDGKLPESMEAEKAELAREQAELADFTRNLITKLQQQLPERDESPKPKPKPQQEEKPEKKTDPSKFDL